MIDYSKVEAGPDLDRMIARRLIVFTSVDDYSYTLHFGDTKLRFHDFANYDFAKNRLLEEVTIPPYSTDAKLALSFVEKAKDFAVFGLSFERDVDGAGWWKATFLVKDWGNRVTHHTSSANTPELAICRAWLAWKDTQP